VVSAEPEAPDIEARARRVAPIRRLVPHLVTAIVAVAASLLLQAALARTSTPVAPPTITPPTPRPTAAPTTAPAAVATAPPLSAGITSQEIADLRAEDDKLWTAIYLARAISQISEAEAAMRANDLAAVDQALIAADDSLALAYGRAGSSQSDPIQQLRRDASAMREDLYLRPEGMDARLTRLRQTILALIEERT
jgi:hypothetical protein